MTTANMRMHTAGHKTKRPINRDKVTYFMLLGPSFLLLFSREFRGVKLMRALYIIPMMITSVVSGIMWRMLFNTDMGMVNYFLSLLHIPPINWLGDWRRAYPRKTAAAGENRGTYPGAMRIPRVSPLLRKLV